MSVFPVSVGGGCMYVEKIDSLLSRSDLPNPTRLRKHPRPKSNKTTSKSEYSTLDKKTVKESLISKTKNLVIIENGEKKLLKVRREGIGTLITPFGDFWLYNFHINDKWLNYQVLISCNGVDRFDPVFSDPTKITMRIDSGCETSQIYKDKTCDCAEQLYTAMRVINNGRNGIIIHIPSQEGRGHGLSFKLATLSAEKYLSMDTVSAAKLMTGTIENIDIRTYGGVIGILKFFGIGDATINILTNNPAKIAILEENGYAPNRMGITIKPNRYTYKHLLSKQRYLNHMGLVRC